MTANGYAGKIGVVNLTNRHTTFFAPETSLLKKYLGGKALGAYLLLEHCRSGCDPFNPDNPLIFVTGPLTGSGFPATSRSGVLTRSPLTGGFLDSYAGGDLGWRLKHAGLDGLIIKGRAERPVLLYIEDGQIDIKDAGHLWGHNIPDTVNRLKKDFGHCRDIPVNVAAIGPAGENRVRFADIVNDNRHFGRGGAGAVMGSKNLKALVVKGDQKPPVSNEAGFKAAAKQCRQKTFDHPLTGKKGVFPKVGTMMTLDLTNETGTLPTRNWQENTFEAAGAIGSTAFSKHIVKQQSCLACPIGCGRDSKAGFAGKNWVTQGPEYETMYSFGSNCAIDDPAVVIAANRLCNDLGLDTISCGVVMGFAMECHDTGLLKRLNTDNIDLSFGNGSAILELIPKIAKRQGLGDHLAEGVRRLSVKMPGSGSFAMHVKGLELPGYDPRGMKGQGLTYAVADRGGCHLRSNTLRTEIIGIPEPLDRYAYEGKAGMVRDLQLKNAVANCVMACVFGTFAIGLADYAKALSCVLDWKVTEADLLVIAERALNMARIFNHRQGFSPAADTLPERLFTQASTRGPSSGQVVEKLKFETMRHEYYSCMNWDTNTGLPLPDKLKALELTQFVR